jgi:uncharacterized membrane protein (TIGR02234 family)
MSPRRQMVVGLGFLLLGSAAVLLAVSRPWLSAAWSTPGFPGVQVSLAGAEAAPVVRAAGFVALAGVVAVLATRRRGRMLLGALLTLAGAAALGGCLLFGLTHESQAEAALADAAGETTATVHASDLSVGGWPVVAAAGGALVTAGGVLTLLRGSRWPVMGVRYEPRAASARPTPDDPWGALDRGEDPTARG